MATIGSTGYLFSDHPGVRGNFTLALDLLGQPDLKFRFEILSKNLVDHNLEVTKEIDANLKTFNPSTFRLSVRRDAPALDQKAMQTILDAISAANGTFKPADVVVEAKPGVEGSFLIRPNFATRVKFK